jgi:endo-1,4-beta-xylanase
MKSIQLINKIITIVLLVATGCSMEKESPSTLKEAFKELFYMGVAVSRDQIMGTDTAGVRIIRQHFNSITAENCMKSKFIQPSQGVFDFSLADRFVVFGEENGMRIIGHVLIWHSQAPDWFFKDDAGDDVSREVLVSRMQNHISALVGRYKGRVDGWDVVNEAIEEDGSWRKNKFYEIIGKDYVRLAFEFAHSADPDAELYYNDYSMAVKERRDSVVMMVKELQENGVRIDGVGMQAHLTMAFPTLYEFEKSIKAFSDLGIQVMITEMDLSALPRPDGFHGADLSDYYTVKNDFDPYVNGLPETVSQAWTKRYIDFFRIFIRNHEKISRVTIWGVSDGRSWLNNFPIPGRTDYPLLFDRQYQPKPLVDLLIKEAGHGQGE